MILSELCVLKRTRKLKTYLSFIKIICTDLLCWIYFVPLYSGSGDESWVCINVNKLKKNKTNVFLDNVILLKLIS